VLSTNTSTPMIFVAQDVMAMPIWVSRLLLRRVVFLLNRNVMAILTLAFLLDRDVMDIPTLASHPLLALERGKFLVRPHRLLLRKDPETYFLTLVYLHQITPTMMPDLRGSLCSSATIVLAGPLLLRCLGKLVLRLIDISGNVLVTFLLHYSKLHLLRFLLFANSMTTTNDVLFRFLLTRPLPSAKLILNDSSLRSHFYSMLAASRTLRSLRLIRFLAPPNAGIPAADVHKIEQFLKFVKIFALLAIALSLVSPSMSFGSSSKVLAKLRGYDFVNSNMPGKFTHLLPKPFDGKLAKKLQLSTVLPFTRLRRLLPHPHDYLIKSSELSLSIVLPSLAADC
jgi:hypothetical protein